MSGQRWDEVHVSEFAIKGTAFIVRLPDRSKPGTFVTVEHDGMEWDSVMDMPRRKRTVEFRHPDHNVLIIHPDDLL